MVKKAAKQTKKIAAKSAVKKSVRPVKSAVKKSAKSAKKTAAAARKAPSPDSASLTHRLDSLLHTMRCISQHEDELCTLLHDARRSGKASGKLLRELHAILEELPADEYAFDLDAVREMVTGTATA